VFALAGMARAAAAVLAVTTALALGAAVALDRVEAEQRDRYPAPGRLVDIGHGRLVHIRQWGMDNRGPVIILDAAASLPSSAWAWIARDLSRTHRVVAYDRPGMGWSTGGTEPRDARSAAQALGAALRKANLEPPYVIVGHSYGGFSARMFAHLQRADVEALVLLDTTHEDGGGAEAFATFYRARAVRGQLGLFGLFGEPNGLLGLPPEEAAAGHAVALWRSHLDATADELEAWPISAAQLREWGGHGSLPLLVVAAYGSDQQYDLQRDLARLSSNSRYVELDVWHTSLLFDRDHAALVAAEIRDFLAGR
jgi:pimeloyl-ACP methyl ester carboxylesterase